jgi:hypothetical protein
MSSGVATSAQDDALLQLTAASLLRPAPHAMLLFHVRILMVGLEILYAAASGAWSVLAYPRRSSFSDPSGLILGLLLFVEVWHDVSVVQVYGIHKNG